MKGAAISASLRPEITHPASQNLAFPVILVYVLFASFYLNPLHFSPRRTPHQARKQDAKDTPSVAAKASDKASASNGTPTNGTSSDGTSSATTENGNHLNVPAEADVREDGGDAIEAINGGAVGVGGRREGEAPSNDAPPVDAPPPADGAGEQGEDGENAASGNETAVGGRSISNRREAWAQVGDQGMTVFALKVCSVLGWEGVIVPLSLLVFRCSFFLR